MEPGADERNEGRLGIFGGVVEVDGEERCGFAEADFAVGGGKELDVDDFTDGSFAVEEGAADEVGDIEGVGVERGELRGRDHQLTAGEEFGFGDGVGGSELEDNAPGIFADGEKVGLDGSRGGTRCGGIGRSRDEGDLAAFGEWLGTRGTGEDEIDRQLDVRRRGLEAGSHHEAVQAGQAWAREQAARGAGA